MPSIPLTTPSASYDITIGSGLLRTLYPRLRKLKPLADRAKPFRPFLVTSPNIWGLWHERVLSSFPQDAQPTVLFLPPGERHKRLPAVESLAEQLAAAGADRDALLLALGGGVLGDITGFLAAIYMRGVPYVQLPTTLLAQVDSAVGGKTGVNLAAGKNLIGAFHHPLTVLSDTDLLATLPPAELRSGLQESIKAAVIYDAKLFRYMETNADAILAENRVPQVSTLRPGSSPTSQSDIDKALTRVVTASVRVKAAVVSEDEKEHGLRMILNFGHTLGHAIEAATGYKQLLHGQAIGWGMIAAAHLSLSRGVLSRRDHDRIVALILRYGPLPPFTAKAEKLVALTAADKKNRSGQRAFVLATGIGSTQVVKDVTEAELLDAANAMLTLTRQ